MRDTELDCPDWCESVHDKLAEGRCHTEWCGIEGDNAKLLFRYVQPPQDNQSNDLDMQIAASGSDKSVEVVMTLKPEQQAAMLDAWNER